MEPPFVPYKTASTSHYSARHRGNNRRTVISTDRQPAANCKTSHGLAQDASDQTNQQARNADNRANITFKCIGNKIRQALNELTASIASSRFKGHRERQRKHHGNRHILFQGVLAIESGQIFHFKISTSWGLEIGRASCREKV